MNPDDRSDEEAGSKPSPEEVSDDDSEVGYCKPPVGTRFVRGKSGNPRGRRARREDDLSAIVNSVFLEKVRVQEGQRIRTMPKIRALLSLIVNAGLKGDIDTACKVLLLAGKLEKNNAKKRAPQKKVSLENLSAEEKGNLMNKMMEEQQRILNTMSDAEIRAYSEQVQAKG